ncbi:MAG: hypothetical protein HC844_20415, partial [Tabrizicola sp.]|nr:hypothetical protein [Tabrizicola sp.]
MAARQALGAGARAVIVLLGAAALASAGYVVWQSARPHVAPGLEVEGPPP